ncbi:MAG: chromosomal replication initiator protein DnaA, partial [Chlamydiota bacterium]|nr:chromosomal replication initiator protein DnaA [Chlamydiota bacterium]
AHKGHFQCKHEELFVSFNKILLKPPYRLQLPRSIIYVYYSLPLLLLSYQGKEKKETCGMQGGIGPLPPRESTSLNRENFSLKEGESPFLLQKARKEWYRKCLTCHPGNIMPTSPHSACLASTEAIKHEERWQQFTEDLKGICSPLEYSNWIAPITYLSSENGYLSLSVPNLFVKEYVLEHYAKEFNAFIQDIDPHLQYAFVVQADCPDPVVPPPKPKKQPLSPHAFNSCYTFDNFIEGPSNQFIKAAALGVAANPSSFYNPLFIHGGVGLGKTHLLHAIGQTLMRDNPSLRLAAITTESFINDLVSHLKNKKVDQLKGFYRNLDVFLVDDIQFLQNRLSFEDEFCHMFESLMHQKKQIVLVSDLPPAQLSLSQRLIARMECGLVAHVSSPDLETRAAILPEKAAKKQLPLSQEVIFYIAEKIEENIRQLEGAINRISAHCQLIQANPTLPFVQNVLKDIIPTKAPPSLSLESILRAVAFEFNLSPTDLLKSGRKHAKPRQIAIYLAKKYLNTTLTELGKAFSKSHTTILHAYKAIDTDPSQGATIDRIQGSFS